MKIDLDPTMLKALLALSEMQYSDCFNSESKAIGEFVSNVILPLTANKNSNQFKDARQTLIVRGRNAKIWNENNKQ